MLYNAYNISQNEILNADVCIVGAGAAGIPLARSFNNSDIKVILLESGGMSFNHKTQFLYKGEISGHAFTPLEFTRRRQFGGSTTTWAGRCYPLDESDFESRDWVPHSGWPISLSELKPYYEKANYLFELGGRNYETDFWDREEQFKGFGSTAPIESKIFHFSPPTRFGETYRSELEKSRNIHVYLHANTTQIQLDKDGGHTSSVKCMTLNKTSFEVTAKYFILAMGGLETTRLMLTSNDIQPNGIGNQHDLLGRFFMDHVGFFDGEVLGIPENLPRSFYQLNYAGSMKNIGMTRAIGLTSEYRQKEKMLNACAFIVKRPTYKTDDRFFSHKAQDLIQTSATLKHTTTPSFKLMKHIGKTLINFPYLMPLLWKSISERKHSPHYGLQIQLECTPNPQSRVTLSNQKDALGINRINLNWQLTQQDVDSYLHFREVLFDSLNKIGFKTRKFNHDLDGQGWPISLNPTKHHAGTTRMHKDERYGVVNEHCQVHGVYNLYIASGSVFPTSGMANPTLTIVAMALRLADKIKHELHR